MSDQLDDAQALEERERSAALAKLLAKPVRPSQRNCSDCGAEIPLARRQAVPGVKLCIGCAEAREGK